MGKRREGREAAVQFLFSRDLNQGANAEELDAFWSIRDTPEEVRGFAGRLITGTIADLPRIDAILEAASDNFRLARFSAVDRNILRLAVYELLHMPDTDPAVVINEAIEIAKRFGTEKSARFVHGVLDRARRDVASAGTTPPEEGRPAEAGRS